MTTQAHIRRPALKDYSKHHQAFSLINVVAWALLILSPITPLLLLWFDASWSITAGAFVINLVGSLLLFSIGFGGAAISDIAESNNKMVVIQWEAREKLGNA